MRRMTAIGAAVLWFGGVFLSALIAQEAPTSAPTAVAIERERNEAFLAQPEIKTIVDGFDDAMWIAIWNGDAIEVDKDLTKLLERIEKPSKTAAHRFVFRKSMRSDRTETTTLGYEQAVGAGFDFGRLIAIGRSPDGERSLIQVNDHKFVAFPVEPHVGDGHGRTLIPIDLSAPGSAATSRVRFLYATGFTGTMILPPDVAFPRSEIPGAGKIVDFSLNANDRPTRMMRRFLLRTRVADLGLDRVIEAFGDEIAPAADAENPVVLGRSWIRMSGRARATIAAAKKPVLVMSHESDRPAAAPKAGPLTAAELEHWTLVAARTTVEGSLGGTASKIDLDTNDEGAVVLTAMGVSIVDGDATPWLFAVNHCVRIGAGTPDKDLAAALAKIRALLP